MRVLLVALTLVLSGLATRSQQFHIPSGGDQFQSTLKVGAGGWLVGVDVNADGTCLARADVYGAYIWNGSPCGRNGSWVQLVNQSRMPANYFGFVGTGTKQIKVNGVAGGGGVYEIASAPSNSSIIYMMVNGWIFKSTNRGRSFAVTGTGIGMGFNSSMTRRPDPVPMAPNGPNRECGRKMAVDPVNPDVVYAGTDARGMFVSLEGGNSWNAVSMVPTGTGVVNYSIAFDPSSPAIGGRTSVIYASTNGGRPGVYRSADAGMTWVLMTSGPSTVCHMVVGQNGVVWATDGANGGANGNLWQYANGVWTKIMAAGAAAHSVAVDPSNASRIILGSPGGALNISINGGRTWSGYDTFIRSASDIPWLAQANEFYMSNGDMIFDPSQSNVLVFGQGIGVWTASPPNSSAQITWTSASAGIEELVARAVVAPNSIPITGVSDRSTWYLPNPAAYPANYNSTYSNSYALNETWGLDWAQGRKNFIAGIIGGAGTTNNNSGSSSDGGKTWRPFNSYYQTVTVNSTNVANNGSGAVRLNVGSTTGLSNWSAGSGSIVRVLAFNGAQPAIQRYWPVTVVDSSHIDLQGSSFQSFLQSCGHTAQFATCGYIVYVDTNPLSTEDLQYTVTGTSSDSGLIKITVISTSSAMSNGERVCPSGVGGTTEANGCWVAVNANNNTNSFDLYGSTFVNAWTSGGVVKKSLPNGGAIAVSTPLNMIMSGSNRDYPQCTQDGGRTWSELHIPAGVPAGNVTGWINAPYLNRRPYAADRAVANTFYLYNYRGTAGGTYKVINCTATLQSSAIIANSGFNSSLISVPGNAGHLFLAIGSQGADGVNVLHPQGGALRRSTDGGTTWQAIANTAEPYEVCAGPVAPGSDYPTVYMVGWIRNVWGIWRTTGTSPQWASGAGTGTNLTWTKVADYPLGSMDTPTALACDQVIWNRWYMGFGGSGFTYGQQNYLLRRDLDPAAYDNSPAWLNEAA